MQLALILSDIHGHADKAAAIARLHAGVSYVFIGGDISNFGTQGEAERILHAVQESVGSASVVLGVAGNCDPVSVRKFLREQGKDIEGRLLDFPEFMLTGSGGGLKRPVSLTCYERPEDDLESSLIPYLEQYRDSRTEKPLIVVTHTPPHGTNADNRYGRHVGSSSFGYLLSEYAPSVWICGHIHESRCVSREDETLIINPGPCSEGCYAVLSYNTDKKFQDGSQSRFSAGLGML